MFLCASTNACAHAVLFGRHERDLLGGCFAALQYISFSLLFLYTPLHGLLFVGGLSGEQSDSKETRRPKNEGDGNISQTCISIYVNSFGALQKRTTLVDTRDIDRREKAKRGVFAKMKTAAFILSVVLSVVCPTVSFVRSPAALPSGHCGKADTAVVTRCCFHVCHNVGLRRKASKVHAHRRYKGCVQAVLHLTLEVEPSSSSRDGEMPGGAECFGEGAGVRMLNGVSNDNTIIAVSSVRSRRRLRRGLTKEKSCDNQAMTVASIN